MSQLNEVPEVTPEPQAALPEWDQDNLTPVQPAKPDANNPETTIQIRPIYDELEKVVSIETSFLEHTHILAGMPDGTSLSCWCNLAFGS